MLDVLHKLLRRHNDTTTPKTWQVMSALILNLKDMQFLTNLDNILVMIRITLSHKYDFFKGLLLSISILFLL